MAAERESLSSGPHSSLALLELRLRRLEFLLTGSSNLDGLPDGIDAPQRSGDAVAAKLASLQASLTRLRRLDGPPGMLVREIEALYATFPELSLSESVVPSNDLSTQASVVLSHATVFPETASRLSSLQSLQIPSAEASAKISVLAPEIANCQQDQKELEQEIQDLRQRSARCLEWWVRVGVVGMGDLWEEWEDRLKATERQLARLERRRKEEEGYV